MATKATLQQLITHSTQATANAIASALTAQTASISLPIYNWTQKMPITLSPFFNAPWRTGSFSTAL